LVIGDLSQKKCGLIPDRHALAENPRLVKQTNLNKKYDNSRLNANTN